MTVYRVQSISDGLGPWRPGFPATWSERGPKPPAWFDEFPDLQLEHGYHYGCGCTDLGQLGLWFTPGELARLVSHGYHVVALTGCEIVAQSSSQVVFRRSG